MKIANVEIENNLFLAPMAGVTDLGFRTICREHGAGFTTTEMVSAKALCFQDGKTIRLMQLGENEKPSAVQIFGNDADCMKQAAEKVMRLINPAVIDINMGCPVTKIAGNGDGSALMKNVDNACKIVQAVKQGCGCPVTVKTRKGWDNEHVNAVEFSQALESAGASAITIHGRTKVQMYSGEADWDIIKAVKQNVKIPVIANGDVFEPIDAKRILDYTGADGVMIGRGAFGNPWIFERALCAIKGEAIPDLPPLAERMQTAHRQFLLAAQQKGEHIACLEARKQYSWYLRGVPHSAAWKEKIVKISTIDDVNRITDEIIGYLR